MQKQKEKEEKMIGIYRIVNLINDKKYIGKSFNIEGRWYEHRWALNNNKHENSYLQKSWNKYGELNFRFEIIEECLEELLIEREWYWFEYYGGFNGQMLYNLREPGNYGRHCDEVRKRMSESRKGKVAWNKGLKMQNRVISRKPVSAETREKMSKIHKGKKKSARTNEHRQRLSESQKGKPKSQEARQNMKIPKIPWTEERRKAQSIAIKKMWLKRKGDSDA